MKRLFNMIWFIMLGLYFGCASSGKSPQSNSHRINYEEDLSVHRMQFEMEEPVKAEKNPEKVTGNISNNTTTPSYDVTAQLETILDESSKMNTEVKSVKGFTVQVYSGTSREAADKAKRQVYMIMPDARPVIKYVQPNYKVQVGQFADKLEAQKLFSQLKKEFPSALVLPDRIEIN